MSSSGIRQSTNGGQSWTQILTAATPAVAALLPPNSTIGETLVDLAPPTSPPNPAGIQVLYTSMQGRCTVGGCGVPDPVGFFRSTDQGATWNAQTATAMPTGTQGGYSFAFSVDPASPGDGTNDIVYFGAVGYAKSTDSGNNFVAIGAGMHVDFHSNWVFALQPTPRLQSCSLATTAGFGNQRMGVRRGAAPAGRLRRSTLAGCRRVYSTIWM